MLLIRTTQQNLAAYGQWTAYGQAYYVRLEVLTAASMKMAIFWAVAPCSLVEVFRRFGGACCFHHQGDE
jgi:hypothetical protein